MVNKAIIVSVKLHQVAKVVKVAKTVDKGVKVAKVLRVTSTHKETYVHSLLISVKTFVHLTY